MCANINNFFSAQMAPVKPKKDEIINMFEVHPPVHQLVSNSESFDYQSSKDHKKRSARYNIFIEIQYFI